MDDTTIVQLYWDRDERAIPATSGKYGNYCNSIAWNILGNREDAEECVNDTYLCAWTSMPPHRPSSSVRRPQREGAPRETIRAAYHAHLSRFPVSVVPPAS